LAVVMYAGDQNDYFPQIEPSWTGGPFLNSRRLASGGEWNLSSGQANTIAPLLQSYAPNNKVWVCPKRKRGLTYKTEPGTFDPSVTGFLSYGFNYLGVFGGPYNLSKAKKMADLERPSELGERFSAAIHVSHRFHQNQFSRFCQKRVLLSRFFPCRLKTSGKPVDHKKADVVASMLVFGPGVSETGNQTNLWSFFFHIRLDGNQISQKLASEASTKIERIQIVYFFCSFSFETAGVAAVSPSSFFSPITSGPATASDSATTGSSSTVGARTENAVRSG